MKRPMALVADRIPSSGVRYGPEPFAPPATAGGGASVAPQDCACGSTGGACRCNGAAAPPIYVKGQFDPVFPSLSVEREFRQAFVPPAKPPPERQLIYEVLRQTRNIYIAREMCWVFKIEGVESYIVRPTSYGQLTALISAIAPRGTEVSYNVLIGHGGGPSRPDLCNGRKLPLATPTFLYSFTVGGMANVVVTQFKDLKPPPDLTWATGAVNQMLQLTDNDGVTDGHRAVNLVALRYLGLYKTLWEMHGKDFVLKRVRTVPSRVQGERTIVDVIFTFDKAAAAGAGQEWYCRVDTTRTFPYLVSPMVKYFARP